ncbi:GTPase domain-containing protein [Neoactinobaculum massilliense]|uniref:GTPase domain-containing protein n=1 Tax=Neoactinobaculum massilliense TaxID=2364794 RepID=UPI000F5256F5|nr:GTPase domain-containing protein [Neoactinobaculum massilliense]
MSEAATRLTEALSELRDALTTLAFPIAASRRDEGQDAAADSIMQLDDYVIPRLHRIDAPLLAVVGGSTGSGKSTIVNSLMGEGVTRASALRPTTRRPVLVHAPADAEWFEHGPVLPGLARVTGSAGEPGSVTEVQLVSSRSLPQGLAILDSPDIDSVVAENRMLAAELLGAADLWVFVTTAARYADAIPWALLDQAAERNIVLAVVLNRVPNGAAGEVRPDLVRRLEEHGLGAAPLFVIAEQSKTGGLLPPADMSPLRGWLEGLSEDARARESVARQTLAGALTALLEREDVVVGAYTQQLEVCGHLSGALNDAFAEASRSIAVSMRDGSLLRGEVLQRWQEMAGAGEFTRRIESGVSGIRDRIASFFTGRTATTVRSTRQAGEAIEDTLTSLLVSAATNAIHSTSAAWEETTTGAGMALAANGHVRGETERREDAARVVREWQRGVVALLEEEGEGKRVTARLLSLGVNATGVALMILLFSQTAGLTGGEVAIAGGTAVVAQRLLETVFGDDAVRRLTRSARSRLMALAEEFLGRDRDPFEAEVERLNLSEGELTNVTESFEAASIAARKELI